MTEQQITRRLAAILAADVAGYSRMMEADEAGTVAALRQIWSETFNPAVAARRGRIVKTMGDGALVEFGSVDRRGRMRRRGAARHGRAQPRPPNGRSSSASASISATSSSTATTSSARASTSPPGSRARRRRAASSPPTSSTRR